MKAQFGALFAIAVSVVSPPRAAAQAFTAPQGFGSITVAWQYVENTGHRFSDGFLLERGESVTESVLFEVDYALTDRLSVTAGLPFVFAKYTGAMPPPSRLPVDACACWHSSFQDVSVAARYRFGDDRWAVTPTLRFVQPTHGYRYEGEAVVGRRLQELQLGVNTGVKLQGALRKASIQAGYAYAFVEKPLPEVSINRSNATFDAGYALTDRLFVHGIAAWNHTHGGLRIGSPTGDPFFPPGELNTPERFAQRDRLLSTQYWQTGAGAAYSFPSIDVFASFTKYVWGRNAHNGQAYTVGVTWYFDRSRL